MNIKPTKFKMIILSGLSLLIVLVFISFIYFKNKNIPSKPSILPTEDILSSSVLLPEVTPPTENISPTPEVIPPSETSVEKKPEEISGKSSYPLHTNITATVFWVGEPKGGGSSEDNALSAWDDSWQKHYGCFDNPNSRNGFYPKNCTPKENPFYFDLPYDDFDWEGNDGRRANAFQVVPWAKSKKWGEEESMLKNRWIKVIKGDAICYAQWEDAGPYVYNDANYVFGKNDARPKSKEANNAGMDVSPALRDCLKFVGLNNDSNKVSWQFMEAKDVPAGPWKNIVTTSGTFWK